MPNRFVSIAVLTLLIGAPALAPADLFDGLFGSDVEQTKEIWQLREQTVRLIKRRAGAPNDHPATVDKGQLAGALRSVRVWEGGGVFRDDEQRPVFTDTQATLLATYLATALAQASPDEDVHFVMRGYSKALMDTVRELHWDSGLVFMADGRLNLIFGEYRKQQRKDMKGVKGSFGITDGDVREMSFKVGSREREADVSARLVNADGIVSHVEGGERRRDWLEIDINTAAAAFAESQIDPEERRTEERLKAEAAKRTLETREMKTELARLRSELKELQRERGGGSLETIEQRLETLDALKGKGLITEDEYAERRSEILQGI